MESTKIEQKERVAADVIAFSKNGEPVLLVEVKSSEPNSKNDLYIHQAINKIISYLRGADELIPFAMLVTLKNIQIYQWDGIKLSEPIACLQTGDVLSYYETEFKNKKIFHLYLTTLVEAWLRDLAYHWKFPNPPAKKELETIGLVKRLVNGTTQAEVIISNDTLR
ncbi:hypothetical protein [Aliterella atlantica]|uniref:Type I restriction enzyme R protein N-terminal domain-containing protein n=1 Tax=Aliterella atlantica CENA595 TaxID=1618023 RepID=A0A0D8ZNU3_9CYAN|nr:hypothetical protein [Aliterella atlantica]KJH70159.1 hypothetical protein UH38_19350 [Aliterella atlantica CENA595]